MNTIEVERSSGNVYADLGFHNAPEMLGKAQLVAKIGEILTTRKWTLQYASKVLGISQPKLSNLLRGRFRASAKRKGWLV